MDFNDYQLRSRATARYHHIKPSYVYPTLGLVGEAGEVAEKIKKVLRDNYGEISPEVKDAIKLELGDVLWYVAQLATELDFSLGDVAASNLQKLADRAARDALKGSGDYR